ncbi:MAG TPA: non-canonical purine NTP pyrophosphatase [Candidatus Saccharimonadales bacterium]|nr:non-canonical purine NTP pyrophosphatase [Candidatus Saccharimonadales bacterium]
MIDLTFITGNQFKADYLAQHLGLPVRHHKLDLDEIQSLDARVVVEHKVRQAYDILHSPVLVEDAGLTLTAMGRLPGTYIKWFMEELGAEGMVRMAAALPSQEAIATVCFGLYDGGESVRFFEAAMHGRIADHVDDGTGGFGYAQIFINDGYEYARSSMTPEEFDRTSQRMAALIKLRSFLTSQQ